MNLKPQLRASSACALALLVLSAGTALSQAQTGNIYGKVVDDQGQGLPGVTVTLSGIGAPSTTVSNAQGDYRYLNLAPGTYSLAHALSGFAPLKRDGVVVAVGRNTELTLAMKLSVGVTAEMVVTGETPLLDTRKVSTGASISQTELASIPTARDPWVLLQSVPGVLTDRINVGGNESGQQSNYVAKGSSGDAQVWNVDGVNITDVGAVGSSPTYYDFDSFQEMQVSTGGSDVTLMTAGASLNMVTKRGTNDVHGSARVFATDKRWQSSTDSAEAEAQGFARGNRIDDIQDYGFELGGPVIADRLWLWGSYGRNQINLRTPATALNPDGFSDRTTLEDVNGKLNAQLTPANAATVFFLRGDKIKLGRNAAPTRPQETTWDQTGPTSLYKFEDSHIFSSNLFATALISYVDGGFALAPQGGLDAFAYRSPDGVNHGSYLDYSTFRPQTQLATSASAFARTGEVGHEFKVGFSYRTAPVSSATVWPHGLRMIERTPAASGASRSYVRAYRTSAVRYDTEFLSGYLSDTLTLKDLTINVGARYDQQSGNNRASTSAANTSFPDVIPAISQTEDEEPFKWKNVSPRIGLTYALGPDQKKTLIRASYGRFVDNLGGANIFFNNNTQYGYVWYGWNDANGNHIAERSEVNFNNILYAYNLDPTCLTCPNPNRTDPNLDSPTTDEIVIGAERELFPGVALSINGTYRKFKNFVWGPQYGLNADGSLHVLNRNDFEQVDTLSGSDPLGNPYSIPVYGLKASAPAIVGRYLTNRPDYSQEYKGLELQINKRYSNKWSMRAGFAYNDWTQSVGQNAVYDPTNQLNIAIYGDNQGGSNENGGQVALNSGVGSGAKADIYVNSKWTFNINALYSLPAGFNVAGNFFARQGNPKAFFTTDADPGDGLGTRNALIAPIDAYRHPTVTNLDLRVEKAVKISALNITLSVDLFNVLNTNVVLQRKTDITQSAFDGGDIVEVQSPRVVRFGGRVSF